MMKFERTLAIRFLQEGRTQTALIVGGTSAGAPLASAELFMPWSGAFSETPRISWPSP